jgi:hypothetical protein
MTARPVACLLFALSLSACSAEVEFAEPPINPAPRDEWTYDLLIEAPVRPVQRVEMVATYNIVNRECLARELFTGAPKSPASIDVPLTVEATSEGGFRAAVFADWLLPADLYGEGECRWELAGVYSALDDGVVRFQHSGFVRPLRPDMPLQSLGYTAFERSRFDRDSPTDGVMTSFLTSLKRDQPIGPVVPDDEFTSRFPLDRYVRVRSLGRPAN